MGEAKRKRVARQKALDLAESMLADLTPAPNKVCGGCTACCSSIPVKEIGLGAWQRCPHLGDGCCSIYEKRPVSCAVWSCGWRINPQWEDDLRPDRCGFIVDPIDDLIWVNGAERAAIRIWVLPGFEDAWQYDPGHALILALVHAGHFALWDMAPNAEGQRLAITFGKDEHGNLGRSAPTPISKTDMGVGERAWRAAQLSRQ